MVRLNQIQTALARYVDEEFTSKLTGWQKWVVGAGAAMLIENVAPMADAYRSTPMVSAIGVFDAEGNVDEDRLYQYFRAEASKTPVTFHVPVLGSVTLNEQDVDKLYRLVKES